MNQFENKENKEYKDFLQEFCNFNSLQTIFLSFDVDWAPDYMLEDLINILGKTSATFMITHDSKCVRQIEENFSIGTHPNLSKGSSQGEGIDECIEFYKSNKLSSFSLNRFHIAVSYK